MPRKANEDRGTCPCPTCQQSRPVRKEKSGALYIWCASPCKSKCHAQDYILSNATMSGKPALEPATEPEEVLGPVVKVPAPEPEPEPSTIAPEPEPKPKTKPAKPGFFSRFNTVLDEG